MSPFFIPGRLINLRFGLHLHHPRPQGPEPRSVVTACSTGAHAIGDGARMIALGDADVMVAGGARIARLPYFNGWLCGLPRACDGVQ